MTINLELPVMLPMTAEEFARLPAPEGIRLELWDGNLDMAAAAQMHWHSRTMHRILSIFLDAGREASSETGVVLGPRAVRAPDVTRFRPGFQPEPRSSQFPAAEVDLVVEIVSPESQERDRVVKPLEYARAGIPEFWLVEEDDDAPLNAVVNIFRLTIGPSGQAYALMRRIGLAELEAEQ
jgi:Uma2 family endonuclease